MTETPVAEPKEAPAKATAGRKFKIGVLPFLNTQPLVWGLAEAGHTLVPIPPSRQMTALCDGRLDVAIAPIAAHLINPNLPLVPVACISSKGPVLSVRLLHQRDLHSVLRLWADSNSLTSVLLSRLILKRWYGVTRLEVKTADMSTFRPEQAGPWDVVLQIGDVALQPPPFGLRVTDLGEEWHRRTGKPFVFACWTARDPRIAVEAAPILQEALDKGRAHFDDILKAYKGVWVFDHPRMKAYLQDNLRFDYGREEDVAVHEFGRLIREEGLL